MNYKDQTICIIGLGYVGLPLAVEFGKSRKVIGFDLNSKRISDLEKHYDSTKELEPEDIAEAIHLNLSSREEDLNQASIFIVTVPTPIDKNNSPDLQPLLKASATVGQVLKKGDIVIFESTVYPGATEEGGRGRAGRETYGPDRLGTASTSSKAAGGLAGPRRARRGGGGGVFT